MASITSDLTWHLWIKIYTNFIHIFAFIFYISNNILYENDQAVIMMINSCVLLIPIPHSIWKQQTFTPCVMTIWVCYSRCSDIIGLHRNSFVIECNSAVHWIVFESFESVIVEPVSARFRHNVTKKRENSFLNHTIYFCLLDIQHIYTYKCIVYIYLSILMCKMQMCMQYYLIEI